MTEQPTLVPLDGSRLSEAILAPILPLLRRREQPVVLLRVVRPRGTAAEQSEALDIAQQRLDAATEALAAKGLRVSSRLERGQPATIVELEETLIAR